MESATAGLAGGGLPGAVCPLFRLKPVVKAWPGAKTWLKDRVAVVSLNGEIQNSKIQHG